MFVTVPKHLGLSFVVGLSAIALPHAAHTTMLGEIYDWLALGLGQSDGASIVWRVGDSAVYKSMGWFGTNTMTKTVREVDDAYVLIGVVHQFGGIGGDDGEEEVGEYRIRRVDNKIVMARSLTDASDYSDFTRRRIDRSSSEETTLSVPAGTFDCTNIIGHEDGTYEVSTCVTPVLVPMEGAVQMSHGSHMGTATYRLRSFAFGA